MLTQALAPCVVVLGNVTSVELPSKSIPISIRRNQKWYLFISCILGTVISVN